MAEAVELLSVKDLAARYGVGAQTVYGWRYRGILPTTTKLFKRSKRLYWLLSDIEVWEVVWNKTPVYRHKRKPLGKAAERG